MPQRLQRRRRATRSPNTPPLAQNKPPSSSGRRVPSQKSTSTSTNTTGLSNLADEIARPKVDGAKSHKIRLKDEELELLKQFLKTEKDKDQKRSNESIFEDAACKLVSKCGEASRYDARDLQDYWMTRGKKQNNLAWPPEDEARPDRTAENGSTPKKAKVKIPGSLDGPTLVQSGLEIRSLKWTKKEENSLLEEVKSTRAAGSAAGPSRDSDMTFWSKIQAKMKEAGYQYRSAMDLRQKWHGIYKEEVEDDEQVRFGSEKETLETKAPNRPLPPKDRYNSSERAKRKNENASNDDKKDSGTHKAQPIGGSSGRRVAATKSPLSRVLEKRKRRASKSTEEREPKKRRQNTSKKVCDSDEQSWRSNFEVVIRIRQEYSKMEMEHGAKITT
jgi:hypothetical protein